MNESKSTLSERLTPLAGPAYLVAALLVVTPLGDFLSGVWPWRPGAVDWRFASSGLLSGFLLTPLLGVLLAIGVAAGQGNSRALRGLGIVALVVAVLCSVVFVAFILDAIQLNSRIPAEQRRPFLDASIKALVKYVTACAAYYLLGIRAYRMGGWRVSRRVTADRAAVIIEGGRAPGESAAG